MSANSSNNHWWYGPCDGFGPNGACSECKAMEIGGYTSEWEAWLHPEPPAPGDGAGR